jgi:hypothetical protein
MRIRLKASFDISGFSPVNQVILTAMQQYGLILADNGGNFYFQGASDPRFDDNDLVNLEQIASSNFEVVQATPEFPGYDSATAPKGAAPTINSFSATASSVSAGNPFTLTYSASFDSYDYIDTIGPVSGGSVTIAPTETNTYTLYSTNAYGRSESTPITVTVPGSMVAAPTFTPVAGTYSSAQTVTINTATSPAATIYYTTDGTTPTTSSTEYSGPIIVSATQPVKAIATVTGYSAPSAVGSAAYTIGSADTVGSLVKAKPAATPAVAQAPALVNHASSTTTDDYAATTGAISTTGANFGAVCVAAGGYLYTVQTVTDSAGNTYHWVQNTNESDDIAVGLYVGYNIATGSSVTVSTSGQAYQPSITAMFFSNVASGPDRTNSAEGFSNPFNTGSVTQTNNDELIVSCVGAQATAFSSSNVSQVDSAYNGGYHGSDGYAVQTTRAALNPLWTATGSPGLAGVTASFYSTLARAPLVATTANLPEGFVSAAYGSISSPYSNQLTATGGVLPYSWTVSAGTLPAGLSLSTGGLITGTPTTAISATSVTFKATDAQSTTATATVPITIAAAALTSTAGTCTGSALDGTQYTAFGGCTISGSGGTAPLTFSWSTGSCCYGLPEGLSESSSTGAISGTLTGTGNYPVTFITTDSLGSSITQSPITFSINGNYTQSGWTFFPSDSIFHQRVDSLPLCTAVFCTVDADDMGDSPQVLTDVGSGIPYAHFPYNQPFVGISCPGPQCYNQNYTTAPISPYATIEGTQNQSNAYNYINDGHSLSVILPGGGNPAYLYEMYNAQYNGGPWLEVSDVMWDLSSNSMPCQECGTTDAAGLPIAPLLYTYDEVSAGTTSHPGRFTLGNNRLLAQYVWPATNYAQGHVCTGGGYQDGYGQIFQTNPPSSCIAEAGTIGIPYGQLYRLKASVAAPAACAGNTLALNMLTAWKQYGMMMADGGENGHWYVIAAQDARWGSQLGCIWSGSDGIVGADFEVPATAQLIANLPSGCPATNGDCATLDSYQVATGTFYTLTVTTSGYGSIGGSYSTTGSYPSGSIIGPATATTLGGSTFTGWSGTLGCTGTGTCSGTLTGNATMIATFTGGAAYTLTVSTAGGGSGTITGTNCTSGTYYSGNAIGTCTATPSAGSTFTGWSGTLGCTGTSTCSGTITSNATVIATFTPCSTCTLTVATTGAGTGTVSGINCTTGSYVSDTTIGACTATPTSGEGFIGWNGCGQSGTGTVTFLLTTTCTLTATFSAAPEFTLTVSTAGTGSGTIIGAGCSSGISPINVLIGNCVATPAGGSTFAGWSGTFGPMQSPVSCPSNDGACEGFLSGNATLIATFNTSGTSYTLTTSTAGSGTGTISGSNCSSNSYLASSTIGACTATPSSGSTFAGWSGTLGCTGTSTCTGTLTGNATMIATFTINLTQAATPTFSPTAGTYSSAQTVTIGTATPSATIYYTTNGSTPTTGSAVYSGPITVSSTETLQAIAVASGYSTSATGTAVYTITLSTATPTFSPATGTYSSAQTVTIATATPSATIYYTTNGSTPTTSSAVYSGPITVSATETLEAIAAATGYSTSAAGSAAYTITSAAVTPTFSPATGTYSSAQTVTIGTTTPGATIYYTTNGSTPTTSSAVYSGPITVSATETLEAIAAATGYSTSAAGSAAYTINLTQVATPSFTVAVSPASLTVTAGQSGTTTILVTPQNAFGGAVSFSCSGLPSGASCSFSPATVTMSGAVASTTLTVTTAPTIAALHRNPSPLFPGSVLAVAFCCFGWKKRRGLRIVPLVLVALGLSLCTSCSVGVWSTSPPSTVTVIATGGSLQPTTSFTLTVQ